MGGSRDAIHRRHVLVRKGAAWLAAGWIALAAGDGARAQGAAGPPARQSALASVERFVDAGDYWAGFVAAFNLRREDDQAYGRWAEARALKLPAAYLMPLALRVFKQDPAKGLNWFYFSRLRLLIDLARCHNDNAGYGLVALIRTVEELTPGLERHPGRAAAWKWALDHDARHPEPVLPGWDCAILANFPRVTDSADVGRKLGETAFPGKPSLKPESQWAESRGTVRLSFERNMRAFVGDPATQPAKRSPAEPLARAPLPPPPKKPEIPAQEPAAQQVAKAPPAPSDKPESSAKESPVEQVAKAPSPSPQDKPESPASQREAIAEALRREAQPFPEPPEPPSRHGRPGKFGPVPTGEPDDPFHIAEVQGDGWRLLDSGPGLTYADLPFYWLDGKRVFFGAYNTTLNQVRNRPYPGWHFVWDADQGIRPYADVPLARQGPRYCHADGRLKIQSEWRDDEKAQPTHIRWRVGPEGQEKEVAEPVHAPDFSQEGRWSETACRYVTAPLPLREHVWAALRDGDGYLDFGPSLSFPAGEEAKKTPPERQKRLRLRRFAPDEAIELPIGILEAESICVRYFSFKNAYFLFDCFPVRESGGGARHHWSRFNCLPAWWLWRDGRTERMCIPSGPWNGGAEFQVVPTARGLFIATKEGGAAPRPGQAGGYLVKGDEVAKVVSGMVAVGPRAGQANVSADGCRIAFAHTPEADGRAGSGPRRQTIRILDVCADGETKPQAGRGG